MTDLIYFGVFPNFDFTKTTGLYTSRGHGCGFYSELIFVDSKALKWAHSRLTTKPIDKNQPVENRIRDRAKYIIDRYKNRDIQMSSISLQKHIGEGDMKAIFEGIIIKVNLENELFRPFVTYPNYHQTFKNLLSVHLINEEQSYHLEKLMELNITFSFHKGLLLISIPTELPNLSFY